MTYMAEVKIVEAYPGRTREAIAEIRSVGGVIQTTYENLIQAELTDEMVYMLTRGTLETTNIARIREPFKHITYTSPSETPVKSGLLVILVIIGTFLGIRYLSSKRRY